MMDSIQRRELDRNNDSALSMSPDGFWDKLISKILHSKIVNPAVLFVTLGVLVGLFKYLPSVNDVFWVKIGLTQVQVKDFVQNDLLRVILGLIILMLVLTTKYLAKMAGAQQQLYTAIEDGLQRQVAAASDLRKAVLSKSQKAQDLQQSNNLLETFLRGHSQGTSEWNHLSVLGLDLHSVVPLLRRWLSECRPHDWSLDLYLINPDYARTNPHSIPTIWGDRATIAIKEIRELIREASIQNVQISLFAYSHFPAVTGHSINDRIVLFSVTAWNNADHLDYEALSFDYISEEDTSQLDQSKRFAFRSWVNHAQQHSLRLTTGSGGVPLNPEPARQFFRELPTYYARESLLDLKENTVSDIAWQRVADAVRSILDGLQKRAAVKPTVLDIGGGELGIFRCC